MVSKINNNISRRTRGFTLIELLVVITIIAVLMTIGLTVYTNAQKAARDAKRRSDINAIAKALEIYKARIGRYPSYTSSIGRGGWGASDLNPTNYIMEVQPYFSDGVLPVDPINNSTYHYMYYRYQPSETPCENSILYVVGVKKFEVEPKASAFKCVGRDWGTEFDYAVGSYE